MKNKYGIGFLICMLLMVCAVTAAYQVSLNREKEELRAEIKAQEQRKAADEKQTTVTADGQALKEDCYYLMERNGYVVVYLKDKKTAYEYTDILFSELPETIQKEIKNGKYIENTQALYGFLENYSS